MAIKKIDLRKLILESNDLPVVPVVVPEWDDVTVYIRAMSAKERDDWQSSQFIKSADGDTVMSMDNLSASLLIRVLCSDKKGKVRIFKDGDIEKLGAKSANAINRLQEAARKLNGTTEEDEEALLKNLQGQGETSG